MYWGYIWPWTDHDNKNAQVNLGSSARTAKFFRFDGASLFPKTMMRKQESSLSQLRWVHMQRRAMHRHWTEVSFHQMPNVCHIMVTQPKIFSDVTKPQTVLTRAMKITANLYSWRCWQTCNADSGLKKSKFQPNFKILINLTNYYQTQFTSLTVFTNSYI